MDGRASTLGHTDPLVSIVIPAFNAAGSIERTLNSALAQTYRRTEIIVVDDGSSDGTPEIVEEYRRRDPRISLVRQKNAGVAAARNTGIAASDGEFVAGLDADDLWHPTKIAKQVDVFRRSGPDIGLVYAPFRLIDRADRVIRTSCMPRLSGWVFLRHLHLNFVGNASSSLIRTSVLRNAGGYASWLREAGAQGCEDYLLQLRIAAHHQFGVVPEYLVGYRAYDGSMSSDMYRMTKSRKLVLQTLLEECSPDLVWTGGRALADCDVTLFTHRPGWETLAPLLVSPDVLPTLGFRVTTHVRRLLYRLAGKPLRGNRALANAPLFADMAPEEGAFVRIPGRLRYLLKMLAPMDEEYGSGPGYLRHHRQVRRFEPEGAGGPSVDRSDLQTQTYSS